MSLVSRLSLSNRERAARGLVAVGMAAFVGLVYGVVVLPTGVLLGRQRSPNLELSVLATAIVAIGFRPMQTRVERWANAATHGDSGSPYEILRQFVASVGGGHASEETSGRIAKVLADGTRAQWAQVWLNVADQLTLAATWPTSATVVETVPVPADRAIDTSGSGRRALQVRHGGKVLGVLRLQEHDNRPLTLIEERLFRGLASQAGLVLQTVRLEAELSQRLNELSERAEALRSSRERLIEIQDAERVKLERDIHDGAQQHLVALTVNLRLAMSLLRKDPERAARLLEDQVSAANQAIANLTRLSRGVAPRLLVEEGLMAALRDVATTSELPVDLSMEPFARPAPEVEEALYFCCLEALQNVTKHAEASRVDVHLAPVPSGVRLSIHDDGVGFDVRTVAAGRGLTNMRERIDAVGGTVRIDSIPSQRTHIDVFVGSNGAFVAEES